MGAKFISISPTLRHHTLRALCHCVKKNSNSLVGGMILFDHGGGGKRGWKMVVDRNGAPVSPWSACFLCVCTKNFLGYFRGLKKILKNWWEDQLLDPLPMSFPSESTAHCNTFGMASPSPIGKRTFAFINPSISNCMMIGFPEAPTRSASGI